MTDHHDYCTFDEIVNHWAENRPEALALQMDGRTTDFAELDRATRRLIGFFQSRGLAKGDRIAWLGKNSDLYCQLYIAAARMGAVMAPIGWRLAPPEIAYIVGDTQAKLVFVEAAFEETAQSIVHGFSPKPELIAEETARAAMAGHDAGEYTPSTLDDTVLQLYTSGTTGNPKGVELSNANLFKLRILGRESGVSWNEYEADDCVYFAMPCAHIGGTGLINNALVNGVRCHIDAEFTPDGVLSAIEGGATQLFLVPAALQTVVQHPKAAETDFSKLKFVMYGAAPMPLELLKEAVKTMPSAGFVQLYGMTETTGAVTALDPEDHSLEGNKRMRSAGKAIAGVEVQIRGSDNQELPHGEIGEVCVHSPSNTAGYWNLPEATASTIDNDGWVHTGDAAIMDEDGYVYIQDRIKDMIISGGENVYPAEVESAIYGHPAIAEVAVIGIPSEKWGEEVKACVVPKPGLDVDVNEVIGYARERVAAFKAPKSVDIIPELPRNPSGKILRRQLRAPYWEGRDRAVN